MPQINDFRDIRLHPYNIFVTLLLAGLCMIFVGLSAAYLYTRIQSGMAPMRVPFIFLANTLVLLLSSATMVWAKRAYENDKTKQYQNLLLITILLSLIFVGLQILGWQALQSLNLGLRTGPLNAYVTVISILHVIHVLGGIPFLALFYITSIRKMKDPITVLMYFTDPLKKLKLNLLTRYWHFLDILWVYLVLFFYINYFIQ